MILMVRVWACASPGPVAVARPNEPKRDGCRARGAKQKSTAGKLHAVLPRRSDGGSLWPTPMTAFAGAPRPTIGSILGLGLHGQRWVEDENVPIDRSK